MCDQLPSTTANPKHQNFPSLSLTVGTFSKQAPPVSDHDHFLGLTVNDFPLFLNSCKRPLDAFCDLHVCCELCYLEYMKNFGILTEVLLWFDSCK